MSSWPFSFEAETELEEELRRRPWTRRPLPVRRPAARPVRRPWLYPAPYVREPIYLEPAPPEPAEEPVDAAPEDEPQEEIRITKGCATVLQRAAPLNAGDVYDDSKTLPSEPGLYVIHRGSTPIYVGIAEKSIHSRFQQRYKALRDFGLGPAVLGGLTVTSYSLGTRTPVCLAGRKKMKDKSFGAISPTEGLLRVLEQHFIKHFKTKRVKPSKFGNTGSERYTFNPGVTVTLRIADRDPADPPAKVI